MPLGRGDRMWDMFSGCAMVSKKAYEWSKYKLLCQRTVCTVQRKFFGLGYDGLMTVTMTTFTSGPQQHSASIAYCFTLVAADCVFP